MKILVILLCIAAAIACTYPSAREKVEVMVVPKRAKPVIVAPPNEPPPSPAFQPYYLPYNFIIDSAGKLFFYQFQRRGVFCGTGIEWDTPPEFINLQPHNIVQVPGDQIVQFVELNIFSVEKSDRSISIGSLSDTIRSVGATKMVQFLKDSTNGCRWYIRKATQEERIVLEFKKNNSYYDADRIEWDSTQTLFPFPIDEKMRIRFVPPQVEKS